MAKKVFTDESLSTFVDEIKAYTDEKVSTKANTSHNHAASNITSGTLSSDRLPTVPVSKGGTGATTAAGALTNLGLTATATEINYTDGVTSNIQTQLNAKVPTSRKVAGKALTSDIAISVDDLSSGYLNTHPENTPTIIPFIYNDLAFLTKRGGTCTYYSTTNTDFTVASLAQTTISFNSVDNMFDGSPSYNQISTTGEFTAVIDLGLHKTFAYSNQFYIDFGAAGWRAKNISIYVMNSTTETTYTLKGSITNLAKGNWLQSVSHSSKNSSGTTVQGFNKLRIVLSGWNNTSSTSGKRIAQIGLVNYGSAGVTETYISRGGCSGIYGSLIPQTNNNVNLGSSAKKWNNVYATTFTGTATQATQDASGNTITSTYETKTDASAKLTEAKTYTDTVASGKANSSHNHAASNITSGTLSSDRLPTVPVSKGGTGATTAAAALTNLGLTATAAELNKMDGVTATTAELNYVDGVTSNIQTQLDGKQATITGGATTIASSNLTASRALISDSSGKVAVSAVTSTELGYLDGVTSNVQTQLDGKAASSHNHAASNITSGTLSSDRLPTVPISKGGTGATTAAAALTNLGITATAAELNKLDGVTATTAEINILDGVTATTAELNYTDGVTSNIQTQLNGKLGRGDYITAGQKADTTLGTKSTAEGDSTTASGNYSHAEGVNTKAIGNYSHAEGHNTTAGNTADSTGTASHAEGYYTTASGDYSHAEGYYAAASGDYSHAEGNNTKAESPASHAEGDNTTASGAYSHAEGSNTTASGYASHAEGMNTTASGSASHAEGIFTTASGYASHAGGYYTIANGYQYVVGRYNADTTAPTSVTDTTTSAGLFIVGIGTSAARKNGFRINPAGKVYGTGTYGTSGADYAEYFEWFDGNPNNEDRRGRFVTLDGNKIRYATSNDDYILGVVSADPSVAGDVNSEDWHNTYLKDIFGSKIVDVVEVEETTNEVGEIIPAHTEKRWVLNPNYNPDLKYTSREERPEWAAIGIVGKLVVVDDGTCQVNGYCYPNVDGIATASQEKTNYRVMERLDDTHIRIFIR